MEQASYNMKPTAPLMARNPRIRAFCPRQWCHGLHDSTFADAHFSRPETDDTTDGASQLQHETDGTTDSTKPSNKGLLPPDSGATGYTAAPRAPDSGATGFTTAPQDPNGGATGYTTAPQAPDSGATGFTRVSRIPEGLNRQHRHVHG